MDPTVKLLTEELAEVETGFQLEDALVLLKRLLLSFRHLAWSLEQLENLIDWWQDMEPLLKITVPHLITFMDNLEQKGIFRINKAMVDMYAKIAEHYTPEDIDAIGDGFVRMHGIIKKLADPEVIAFIDKLSNLPAQVNFAESRPTGPVGLLFRMGGKECKQGLGLVVELTKALGKIQAGNGNSQAAATAEEVKS